MHFIHLSAPHFLICQTQASTGTGSGSGTRFFHISSLARMFFENPVQLAPVSWTGTCGVVSRLATEVVTWGHVHYGADDHSTVLGDQRSGRNVTAIQANLSAFAAILDDGTVVAWGDPRAGGDYSSWGSQESLKKYSDDDSNSYIDRWILMNFIDFRFCWSCCLFVLALDTLMFCILTCFDISLLGIKLSTLHFLLQDFAGLIMFDPGSADVSVTFMNPPKLYPKAFPKKSRKLWQKHDPKKNQSYMSISCSCLELCISFLGLVRHRLTNVIAIQATDEAFAALRSDGQVVAWGSQRHGGLSLDVLPALCHDSGSMELGKVMNICEISLGYT